MALTDNPTLSPETLKLLKTAEADQELIEITCEAHRDGILCLVAGILEDDKAVLIEDQDGCPEIVPFNSIIECDDLIVK